MAELIGVASGVAGLLSLTITVTTLSTNYISGVKNAPASSLALQNELKNLKTVLLELDRLLEHNEAAEQTSRPSVLSSLGDAKECKDALEKLQRRLDKNDAKTGLSAKFGRMVWPFSEEEVNKTLDVLRRYIGTCHLAVGIDAQYTQSKILAEVKSMGEDRREEKKTRVLDWLSPASNNMQLKQRDTLSQRVGTTGSWLLEHDDFKRWRELDAPPVLWCVGDPGTGKTVLSSIVAEHLGSGCATNEIALAVLYCDYKNQENQTAERVLGSIARQLVQWRWPLFKPLEDLYRDLLERNAPLALKDYEALILAVSRSFREAFIVVDALDELDTGQRRILLPAIRRIQQNSVKIMVTSRPHVSDIDRTLRGRTQIAIQALESDIRLYAATKLEEDPDILDVIDDDEELMETVVSSIARGAHGMFLLAAFQVRHVLEASNKYKVKQALGTMPVDMSETYKESLNRIRTQSPARQQLAFKVLGWIWHAKRPLLVDELRHALAVDFQAGKAPTREINLDKLEPASLLVQVCLGLIAIETESQTVRFVHFTVQEFFGDEASSELPVDLPAQIAGTCLTYLLFDAFEAGPCQGRAAVLQRLEDFKFFGYASSHWGDHIRGELEERYLQSVLELVGNDNKLCSSVQACYLAESEFFRWCNLFGRQPAGFGALHCAASQGLDKVVNALLAGGADPISVDGTFKTPAHWAAWRGHISTLVIFLEAGVDVNLRSKDGFTLLDTTVDQNHEAATRLLLARGVDVNQKGFGGASALSIAASRHENIVRLLLEHGGDTTIQNQFGVTPLMNAAMAGNEGIVKLLLSHGADPKSINTSGNSALHSAALAGRVRVINILLDAGEDVNVIGSKSATPLHMAASTGRKDALRLLLDRGADLEAKTQDISVEPKPAKPADAEQEEKEVGRCIPATVYLGVCAVSGTPLAEAVLHCHEVIVEALLNAGADVNTRTSKDHTLLMMVAYSASHNHVGIRRLPLDVAKLSALAVAKVLLNNGADANAIVPGIGWSAVHFAAEQGFQELIELLFDHGAELGIRGGCEQTALQLAAKFDHSKLSEWFIMKGGDVSHKDANGKTALHYAARFGRADTIKALLDNGADIEARDVNGDTPLVPGVWSKRIENVQCLLDRGADIDAALPNGMPVACIAVYANHPGIAKLLLQHRTTPAPSKLETDFLHIAIVHEKIEVLEMLLERDTRHISRTDIQAGTCLHLAAYHGKLKSARLLLERGSEVDCVAPSRATPLSLAVVRGHDLIVQLLCERGAKVTQGPAGGLSLFQLARQHSKKDISKLLFDAASGLNDMDLMTLMTWACDDLNFPLLRHLMENSNIASATECGTSRSPLHAAAECSDTDFAQYLLDKNADVDAIDDTGESVLEAAIRNGSLGIVKLLLENDVDTGFYSEHADVVSMAIHHGHEDVAVYLIESGLEFDQREAILESCRSGMENVVILLFSLEGLFTKDESFLNGTLLAAAASGHEGVLTILLDNKVDINATNDRGESSLHVAGRGGRLAVVKTLTERGADVGLANYAGRTPLHATAEGYDEDVDDYTERSFVECIELLISNGADVDATDDDGLTPFLVALENFEETLALELYSRGADVHRVNSYGWNALHYAAEHGYLELAELLLARGLDVDLVNSFGYTALHLACSEWNADCVELLLRNGASLTVENESGMGPLHSAVGRRQGFLSPYQESQCKRTVQVLLNAGADLQARDQAGKDALDTALHGDLDLALLMLLKHDPGIDESKFSRHLFTACMKSRGNVTKMLLENGADANTEGEVHGTALQVACLTGNLGIIKQLLRYGADVDKQAGEHNTALQAACCAGKLAVVELLLAEGADVNVSGGKHGNALCAAASKGNDAIVKLLLARDARPDESGPEGYLPIHTALHRRQPEIVKILVAHGADLASLDRFGRSALDWIAMDDNLIAEFDGIALTKTPEAIQVAKIWSTITKSAQLLVKSPEDYASTTFYNLGRCFIFLNNIQDAQIAYEHVVQREQSDGTLVHSATCDHCLMYPIIGPRFVCKTCAELDLCEACMDLYTKKTLIYNCDGHEFMKISRLDWCEGKSPGGGPLMAKTLQWLQGLQETRVDAPHLIAKMAIRVKDTKHA